MSQQRELKNATVIQRFRAESRSSPFGCAHGQDDKSSGDSLREDGAVPLPRSQDLPKADFLNRTYSREYCVSSSASASGVKVNAVVPYSHPLSNAFRFSSLKFGGTEAAMAW